MKNVFLFLVLFIAINCYLRGQENYIVTKRGDTLKVCEVPDSSDFYEFGRFYGVRVGIHNHGSWFEPFFRFKIDNRKFWFIHFGLWDWTSDRQVIFYDYEGREVSPGKKWYLIGAFLFRVGFAHRFGQNIWTDNFRPYIYGGAGLHYSYLYSYETKKIKDGFSIFPPVLNFEIGAYLGKDPQYIYSLSVGYAFVPLFREMEIIEGDPVKNFGSVYLSISLGHILSKSKGKK
jgi:hypothetical protein